MNPLFTSLVRTAVPMIVGGITTYLLSKGIELDANTTSGLVGFLTAAFSYVYYVIARLLETANPEFGVLLGIAKKPVYDEPDNTSTIDTGVKG